MKIKDIIKKNKLIKKALIYRDRMRCHRAYIKSRQYIKSKQIETLKQTKKGRRCFIIGNGPSLALEDLEQLQNEDCFASNSIYKLFDKIEWRPTYFVSQDVKVLDDLSEDFDIITESCKYVFLNSYVCEKYNGICNKHNIYPFYVNTFDDNIHFPDFSADVVECICEGYTVTYACIQLAVYMGYSEIYILGCDHSYAKTYTLEGEIKEDASVESNYMNLIEHKLINIPRLDKTTIAYEKAREECEKRGIKIFNATRGGKLEVFKRVCFDDLVKSK